MPTRAERLADHFIRCAGVAAVYVDTRGAIGALDSVGLVGKAIGGAVFCEDVILCCAPGNHAKVAAAAARIAGKAGRAAALAAVRAAAAEAGISLTPIETVIRRAFVAVDTVTATIEQMQRSGGLKDLNREFKAAREANPKLRYHDFLHDRKAGMLGALAKKTA
jgi:hypothetical protein